MATKALINQVIGLIVAFLRNPDRPATTSLPVNDLTTFSRSKSSVTYTRRAVRAFTKAVLIERQTPRSGVTKLTGEAYTTQGLKALENVNITFLKDLGLGELFSLRTLKPSGATPSKYYTTIRRMVKGGIMAGAIEAQSETTTTVSKPKPANTQQEPKAEKPKPTGDKTVTFGGLQVTLPAADYAEPKAVWTARAKAVGCKSSAPTKAELVVRTITYEALFC